MEYQNDFSRKSVVFWFPKLCLNQNKLRRFLKTENAGLHFQDSDLIRLGQAPEAVLLEISPGVSDEQAASCGNHW